jgi:hypothetical protein
MPDEQSLALRHADQIRTDIANVEIGLEMIMAQPTRMPTRKEVWRAALIGMLGGSASIARRALALSVRPCRASAANPGRGGEALGRRSALTTIPGVGPATSLAYIASIDDPGRFDTSKELGAHLCLTPRVYQSGEIDRAGQISKCGDRMLRQLLYEAGSVLMSRTRKWSRPRAWGVSVARRRGMKRATVAVARKLAVIMHRIWVTGDQFDFGGPAVVAKAA